MWKWLKRIIGSFVLVLVLLVAVLLYNTFNYTPAALDTAQPVSLEVDGKGASKHLAQAIRFETDSTKPNQPDFDGFLVWLEQTYPNVHQTMERKLINQTPLYKWVGRDDSLRPILLAAHYDVVPVIKPQTWVHPPYGGIIADGFVWGRGTLDNKGAVIAILEAAEKMIADGFQPTRSIFFSFGHDEEVSGKAGAGKVADYLIGENTKMAWILDEGSFVLENIIPGLAPPIASINLAEKGYLTVTLTANAAGGHSSMPPKETAVGILAKAIDRLQENPVPGGMTDVSASFFDELGRHFNFGLRVVFANQWLFKQLLEHILSGSASTNAMLRTTTAPTMLQGSTKENVLPIEAIARVNFRIHPRDTVEGVVAFVEKTIDDDRVTVSYNARSATPASPVSSVFSEGYEQIRQSILDVYGPLATVPGLTIAATDARHYAKAAYDAYRINPFKITNDDLARFHGTNERLSIENLERGIRFYTLLMQRQ